MKVAVFLLVLVAADPVQLALNKVNELLFKLDNNQEVHLKYELLQIHQWLYIHQQSPWPREEPAKSQQQPTQSKPDLAYPPIPREHCDAPPFQLFSR